MSQLILEQIVDELNEMQKTLDELKLRLLKLQETNKDLMEDLSQVPECQELTPIFTEEEQKDVDV